MHLYQESHSPICHVFGFDLVEAFEALVAPGSKFCRSVFSLRDKWLGQPVTVDRRSGLSTTSLQKDANFDASLSHGVH